MGICPWARMFWCTPCCPREPAGVSTIVRRGGHDLAAPFMARRTGAGNSRRSRGAGPVGRSSSCFIRATTAPRGLILLGEAGRGGLQMHATWVSVSTTNPRLARSLTLAATSPSAKPLRTIGVEQAGAAHPARPGAVASRPGGRFLRAPLPAGGPAGRASRVTPPVRCKAPGRTLLPHDSPASGAPPAFCGIKRMPPNGAHRGSRCLLGSARLNSVSPARCLRQSKNVHGNALEWQWRRNTNCTWIEKPQVKAQELHAAIVILPVRH